MNDIDWDLVESLLMSIVASVKFKLNGKEISVNRERCSESQMSLFVYIDGMIKGKWIGYGDKETMPEPLVEFVWRKVTRRTTSLKLRKQLLKIWGSEKKLLEVHPDIDEKYVTYQPDFASAKSLVRQFKKIDGLELVTNVTS